MKRREAAANWAKQHPTQAKKLAQKLAKQQKKLADAQASIGDMRSRPFNYIKITSFKFTKGGFGSVALCDFTLRNTSKIDIKDISLHADFEGESGTNVGSRFNNNKVLNVIIKAGHSRHFDHVNFGLISDQASKAALSVVSAAAM